MRSVDTGRCGGMADATDSKSVVREDVGVRAPSPVRRGIHSSAIAGMTVCATRSAHATTSVVGLRTCTWLTPTAA